ncbi:MAG: DUF2155 domain-containing protein [Pseudomonadota bacterium]
MHRWRAMICRTILCSAFLVLPSAALAQDAALGEGATLRLLDRITGDLADVELLNGQTAELGQIKIALEACRFPGGNPSGDAYAFLRVEDRALQEEIFAGWMIASSPALNAMDHARYDVWVIRCKTS